MSREDIITLQWNWPQEWGIFDVVYCTIMLGIRMRHFHFEAVLWYWKTWIRSPVEGRMSASRNDIRLMTKLLRFNYFERGTDIHIPKLVHLLFTYYLSECVMQWIRKDWPWTIKALRRAAVLSLHGSRPRYKSFLICNANKYLIECTRKTVHKS